MPASSSATPSAATDPPVPLRRAPCPNRPASGRGRPARKMMFFVVCQWVARALLECNQPPQRELSEHQQSLPERFYVGIETPQQTPTGQDPCANLLPPLLFEKVRRQECSETHRPDKIPCRIEVTHPSRSSNEHDTEGYHLQSHPCLDAPCALSRQGKQQEANKRNERPENIQTPRGSFIHAFPPKESDGCQTARQNQEDFANLRLESECRFPRFVLQVQDGLLPRFFRRLEFFRPDSGHGTELVGSRSARAQGENQANDRRRGRRIPKQHPPSGKTLVVQSPDAQQQQCDAHRQKPESGNDGKYSPNHVVQSMDNPITRYSSNHGKDASQQPSLNQNTQHPPPVFPPRSPSLGRKLPAPRPCRHEPDGLQAGASCSGGTRHGCPASSAKWHANRLLGPAARAKLNHLRSAFHAILSAVGNLRPALRACRPVRLPVVPLRFLPRRPAFTAKLQPLRHLCPALWTRPSRRSRIPSCRLPLVHACSSPGPFATFTGKAPPGQKETSPPTLDRGSSKALAENQKRGTPKRRPRNLRSAKIC